MNKYMNKYIKNIRISKMHAFYSAFIVLFFFLTWIAGFEFSKISDNSILYPIIVFYVISPFFLVWSLWRSFTYKNTDINIGDYEEGKLLSKFQDVFVGHKGRVETILLSALESDISSKLLEYKRKMNLADHTGRIFASSAIIIPVITWIYAIGLYDDKEKLSNLWALTFSSMTAGFILVTIGVTMLRHAKTIQENIYYMEDKIFHLRKLRVVVYSNPDKPSNEKLYENIYDSLIGSGAFAKHSNPSDADDSKLLKLYELLSKQQDKT